MSRKRSIEEYIDHEAPRELHVAVCTFHNQLYLYISYAIALLFTLIALFVVPAAKLKVADTSNNSSGFNGAANSRPISRREALGIKLRALGRIMVVGGLWYIILQFLLY